MSYKLIIVESPTKVTSVGKYLKSTDNYKITSSMGHIRDLPSNKMNVDISNNFKPNYQISDKKKKTVNELKKLAKDASEIIMASDEDREGEAIAWHICHILNLDPKTTKRIVFHEITKSALEKAIANPRTINQNLVDAQQARRILDRIVGYEISPLLWKKIARGLSGGRVQSVAVRLIYEREQEIKDFTAKISLQANAKFTIDNQEASAELQNNLVDMQDGQNLLESCRQAQASKDGFKIIDKVTKLGTRNPSPPFKTSTLQQEASSRLGFSIRQTMNIAQKLYEAGHITYMRTDSLNLSQQALNSAEKYIKEQFGSNYYRLKTYATKSKGAQEAHEAIRPTDLNKSYINNLDDKAQRLYTLIHKRTIASQMSEAKIEKNTLVINVSESEYNFIVQGQRLIFEGYLKMLDEKNKDVILPQCNIGDYTTLLQASVVEKYSQAPARYTEASLVKEMEELGIGRPSTYAAIINNIIEKEYIIKGDIEPKTRICKGYILEEGDIKPYKMEDKFGGATNKLLPTSVTELVIPFLKEHFGEIMDYEFTSRVEADLDKIALGELNWTEQLKNFYDKFHPLIEKTEQISKDEITKVREVGIDPSDQKMIYARMGKFGAYLQKGAVTDSKEKPLSAQMPKDATIETIQIEAAVKMFQLPRIVGQNDKGLDIIAKSGPYGPYLECDSLRIPIKEYDPLTINLEEAQELIQAKIEAEKNKIINEFGDLKIINGPYGPYITDGEKNGKIPKEFKEEPQKISQSQAQEWFDQTAKPPRRSKKISK